MSVEVTSLPGWSYLTSCDEESWRSRQFSPHLPLAAHVEDRLRALRGARLAHVFVPTPWREAVTLIQQSVGTELMAMDKVARAAHFYSAESATVILRLGGWRALRVTLEMRERNSLP